MATEIFRSILEFHWSILSKWLINVNDMVLSHCVNANEIGALDSFIHMDLLVLFWFMATEPYSPASSLKSSFHRDAWREEWME